MPIPKLTEVKIKVCPKVPYGHISTPNEITMKVYPLWEDILLSMFTQYKEETIPIGSPQSPFSHLISVDQILTTFQRKNITRPYLSFENSTEEFPNQKRVFPHWNLELNSGNQLMLYLVGSLDKQSIVMCDVDIQVLMTNGYPIIALCQDSKAFDCIISQSKFTGRRCPLLTLEELKLLIGALYGSQIDFLKNNGILPQLGTVLKSIPENISRWGLSCAPENLTLFLGKFGIQYPKPSNRGMFGPGGAMNSIADKKPHELFQGIVGLGSRGKDLLIRHYESCKSYPSEYPPLSVVAVYDINPEAIIKTWKETNMDQLPRHLQPKIYSDLYQFLQSPKANMIMICVPLSVDQQIASACRTHNKAPMIITKQGDPRTVKRPNPKMRSGSSQNPPNYQPSSSMFDQIINSVWNWSNNHFPPNWEQMRIFNPRMLAILPFMDLMKFELDLTARFNLPHTIFSLRHIYGGLRNPNQPAKSKHMQMVMKYPGRDVFIKQLIPLKGEVLSELKVLDKLWEENNFQALFEYIFTPTMIPVKKPKKSKAYLFNTWLVQAPLEQELFHEFLKFSYEGFSKLEDLILLILQNKPILSENYIQTMKDSLSIRHQRAIMQDAKGFKELIQRNMRLDLLMLHDWLDLGSLLFATHEYEKAKFCYRVALVINPYFPFAWAGLSALAKQMKS